MWDVKTKSARLARRAAAAAPSSKRTSSKGRTIPADYTLLICLEVGSVSISGWRDKQLAVFGERIKKTAQSVDIIVCCWHDGYERCFNLSQNRDRRFEVLTEKEKYYLNLSLKTLDYALSVLQRENDEPSRPFKYQLIRLKDRSFKRIVWVLVWE